MSHPARVYHTCDQLLASVVGQGFNREEHMRRFWIRRWNAWKVRHPGLPFMIKCAVCSGNERKQDRKHGKWKDSKPRRTIDD